MSLNMQVVILLCEARESLVVRSCVEDSNALGSAVCAEQLAGTKTRLERQNLQANCVGTAMTSQSHRRDTAGREGGVAWRASGFQQWCWCVVLLDAVRVFKIDYEHVEE